MESSRGSAKHRPQRSSSLWEKLLFNNFLLPFLRHGQSAATYRWFTLTLIFVFILLFKIWSNDKNAIFPTESLLPLIVWWMVSFVLTTLWAGYRGSVIFTGYDAPTLANYFEDITPAKFVSHAVDRATFDFVMCTCWAVVLGLGGIALLGLNPLVATSVVKYSLSSAAIQTLILAICGSHVALALSAAWSLEHRRLAATLLPLSFAVFILGGMVYVVHQLYPTENLNRLILKICVGLMICSFIVLLFAILLGRFISYFLIAYPLLRKSRTTPVPSSMDRHPPAEYDMVKNVKQAAKDLFKLDENKYTLQVKQRPNLLRICFPFLRADGLEKFYLGFTIFLALAYAGTVIYLRRFHPNNNCEVFLHAWWVVAFVGGLIGGAAAGGKAFQKMTKYDVFIRIKAYGATKFVRQRLNETVGHLFVCTMWGMIFGLFVLKLGGLEYGGSLVKEAVFFIFMTSLLTSSAIPLPMACSALNYVRTRQNSAAVVPAMTFAGVLGSPLIFYVTHGQIGGQSFFDGFTLLLIFYGVPFCIVMAFPYFAMHAAIGSKLRRWCAIGRRIAQNKMPES